MYKVYVKTNYDGYIVSINSDGFLTNLDGWTEIDSGTGDKYHHAQGNYFPKPIMTEGGAYQYKMVSGKPLECSVEEIAEQEKALLTVETPSQLDMIEAQVTYTAMMTDTLLEV